VAASRLRLKQGITLYKLMVGTTPFKGSSEQDTYSKIVEVAGSYSPQNPYKPNKKIGARWNALIEGLLCKEPTNRLGINGFQDFASHQAFKKFDWHSLENRKMKSPLLENISVPSQNTAPLDITEIAESENEEFKDAYDLELEDNTT
jgi:hypothetical protein